MRPGLTILLLSLITLLVSSAADDLPDLPTLDTEGLTLYEVVRVVVGDTIVVDYEGEEEHVRLIGVDAPETKHPKRPVEYYGEEAAAFTTELLADTWVYLEPDQGEKLTRDRYGRLLAHVWTEDGLLVALEIIRGGYGFYYSKYPFREEYMGIFRAYERKAREDKVGLWGTAEDD